MEERLLRNCQTISIYLCNEHGDPIAELLGLNKLNRHELKIYGIVAATFLDDSFPIRKKMILTIPLQHK